MPKKHASPVDTQIGNRIRVRRMLIGMSQERLAVLLGLTFQQVQKYEKGTNRIGAGRLWQVARILGVPVAYLYEGVANPGEPDAGIAESDAVPDRMEFLATGEGLQLSLAFLRIPDGNVRGRILALVQSLAGDANRPG